MDVALAAALMAGAVHELQNLLATAELSLRAASAAADLGGTKARVARAERNVARARRLLTSMLDVAAGRPVTKQTVNLLDVLRDVRTDVEALVGTTDVLHELPDRPCQVEPLLAARAIANLLENASQAMDGKGRVRLSVRDVAPEQAGRLVLVVEDEGPGLSPELAFTPRTSKQAGHGLGLLVVRAILRAHGGEATCEPAERGARFVLDFGPV